jgi:hypothetical protein
MYNYKPSHNFSGDESGKTFQLAFGKKNGPSQGYIQFCTEIQNLLPKKCIPHIQSQSSACVSIPYLIKTSKCNKLCYKKLADWIIQMQR